MRKPGLTGRYSITVAPRHTADAMGNPGVHVLATPWLVHFCQSAAVDAISGTLDAGEVSVPLRSTLAHHAAAPIGALVVAVAELVEADADRLVFSVQAAHGERIVMSGTHEREVVGRAAYLAQASAA